MSEVLVLVQQFEGIQGMMFVKMPEFRNDGLPLFVCGQSLQGVFKSPLVSDPVIFNLIQELVGVFEVQD